ncbi:hypothetical protein [Kribbella sp. HUAS MG21]|uniref:Uncharacterized protein n=1 Tax=Kribbella sp. HUAS MG21 TaxID=3160966 RepID=A0AAU7T552_9ACTN
MTPSQSRRALDAFRQAVETGNLQGLVDILAPDVVLLTDGGGVAQAALAPVVGAEAVAGALSAALSNLARRSLHPAPINGYPALILTLDGEIDAVLAVRIDDGLITGLYSVRNPHKLSRVHTETTLRR